MNGLKCVMSKMYTFIENVCFVKPKDIFIYIEMAIHFPFVFFVLVRTILDLVMGN